MGNGLSSITWVFISLLSPKRLIGMIGGVFNFIGGLAAVITPIIIGYLAKDGDFRPALFYIGAMAFLGFFSYLILVGKVERIELKEEGTPRLLERARDDGGAPGIQAEALSALGDRLSLEDGEEILITKRGKPVAKVVSLGPKGDLQWPDFRTQAVQSEGKRLSEIIIEERDERI